MGPGARRAREAPRRGGLTARRADAVFAALGDRTRLRIVDRLSRSGPATATTLARSFPITRQAVVKHLQVLSHAGVTSSHRSGREILYRVEPDAFVTASTWIDARAAMWEEALGSLKRQLEQRRRQ